MHDALAITAALNRAAAGVVVAVVLFSGRVDSGTEGAQIQLPENRTGISN